MLDTQTKWNKAAKRPVLSEAEERMHAFQRHDFRKQQTASAKTATPDTTVSNTAGKDPRFMSPAEKMTAMRERPDVRNRFGDAIVKTEKTETPITNKFGDGVNARPTTHGIRPDAGLEKARAEMLAEKALREKAAEPIRVSLDEVDQLAIFNAFTESEAEFYNSDFNRTNLWNCLLDRIKKRIDNITGWNFHSLRVCHEDLRGSNYYEQPPVQKTRGFNIVNLSAPKIYPAPSTNAPSNVIPASAQRRYARNSDDESELRRMSFDDLKKAAQSQYRDKRGK